LLRGRWLFAQRLPTTLAASREKTNKRKY